MIEFLLADLLFALVTALVLTLVFVILFRTMGPWSVWWILALVIFLAAWAGGLWITPFGPQLFGVHWLPFLLAGLFFALLIVAAAPGVPPHMPMEPASELEQEDRTPAAVSVFLWVLLIGLAVAIILAYIT